MNQMCFLRGATEGGLLLLWHGDEKFFPRVRYLWDENALQYLRYETMYFAATLLLRRIREEMERRHPNSTKSPVLS